MDTVKQIDRLLNEILGRGMGQTIRVTDEPTAKKLLKKKGIKFVNRGMDFTVGEDDFDSAEEALVRAGNYDWDGGKPSKIGKK
jgi:hypothetical protein